jgi:hypothetical protein
MVGRCEASGHCSFVDESCPSGFRFGANAGEESETCVGDDIDLPDGGPEDRPVARIGEVDLPCNQTSLVFDASQSEAFGGRNLTTFEWTLRNLNEQVLDRFLGGGQEALTPGNHRLGGTYLSPEINVPTYHGRKALMVDVTQAFDEGGESLRQELAELPNDALKPDWRISFAIGSENAGPGGLGASVRVVDSLDTVVMLESFTVQAAMIATSLEAPSAQEALVPPYRIHFLFDAPGRYWVDNVSVFDAANNLQLVNNGSVEGGNEEWVIIKGSTFQGLASNEDLPTEFRQNGIYTLELRVSDSAGLRSTVADLDLLLSECGGM